MELQTYPITLHHLYISPGHNYFGRPKDGPGAHPTFDLAEVEVKAGLGLVGDRYFGVPAHYDAQVTFVSGEVFAALQTDFDHCDLAPALLRRNIVVEGVPLNQLIGHEFTLESAAGSVRFLGVKHCAPCAWMDAMVAPGAQRFLQGRGGLRARILSDGALLRGPGMLHTAVVLEPTRTLEPLHRPRLPG